MKEELRKLIYKLNNKLIIFSAPSGSGKTTIVRHLLKTIPDTSFSVSACTRKKRPNEIDGNDYYFLTEDEFRKRIANNEFVEYEEVYEGHFYGTLKSEIERLWTLGKNILFDIDVEGGLNIKKQFPEQSLAVFVKPSSVEELKRRLTARNTESEEHLKIRMEKAVSELKYENKFDKILVNEHLENTFIEAEKLVLDFINS